MDRGPRDCRLSSASEAETVGRRSDRKSDLVYSHRIDTRHTRRRGRLSSGSSRRRRRGLARRRRRGRFGHVDGRWQMADGTVDSRWPRGDEAVRTCKSYRELTQSSATRNTTANSFGAFPPPSLSITARRPRHGNRAPSHDTSISRTTACRRCRNQRKALLKAKPFLCGSYTPFHLSVNLSYRRTY